MRIRQRSAALTAIALAVMLVGPAAAADPGPSPLPLLDGDPAPVARDRSEADEAALTLPIVSEEMAQLASDVVEQFTEHPDFAAVEVTEDRSRVVVHWFGEPSAEVEHLVAGSDDVAVEFAPVQYRPAELRTAAESLLADASVASVSVRPDASGLDVSVRADDPAGTRRGAAIDWSARAGFPVDVDQQAPEPAATRQNDLNYHLGGARIYRFEDPFLRGGCSSGFAVVRASDPSQQGMVLAAHCGSLGSNFVTVDDLFAYRYGDLVARDTGYDGAILSMEWSQPFVWTSTWDSNVYTQIDGAASPYIGQELCYSGSYSGLVCGNIVRSTGVHMDLGGDLSSITGFQTQNSTHAPAAGNGDSGGPGYQLVNTANGVRRWAVGIISAIPGGSPTTCQGTPGGGTTDRRCSPVVYSTSVVMIGNRTGWHVPAT